MTFIQDVMSAFKAEAELFVLAPHSQIRLVVHGFRQLNNLRGAFFR
jgi:hypothetical protein